MKCLKLAIVCFVVPISLLISSCSDSSAASMRRMMRDVPEVIEVFEQSREQLEILRTGGFGEREVRVNYFIAEGLSMFERGRWVFLEDWHTIEWLSEQEKEAIVFLLTDEELSNNFSYIDNLMVERDGGSVRTMIATPQLGGHIRGERIAIWYGEAELKFMQDSYSRDLGGGWTLWVYTVR